MKAVRFAKFLIHVATLFATLVGISSSNSSTFPDFTHIVKSNINSAVTVTAIKRKKSSGSDSNENLSPPQIGNDSNLQPFFRQFFPGINRDKAKHVVGSGFVIDADGLVVTAAHVVSDSLKVTVTSNSNQVFNASIAFISRESDIAFLRINQIDLPVPSIGASKSLEVGEWLVAIGSPFNFRASVSKGILSAVGRRVLSNSEIGLLQTDIPLNPGGSGGPLFNIEGQLVGMNTRIFTQSGASQGISFAIPIEDILLLLRRENTPASER